MHLRERLKNSLFAGALHSAAEDCPSPESLAEKLAAQRRWMQMHGIDIALKDSERPRPARRRQAPLPGTVIHFSGNSSGYE
ncbi:MAG: hypothetical protein R3315_01245 [Woeseiaceae bacterium]|nr:hypothetical protein [Woeseiaceae bacterium]